MTQKQKCTYENDDTVILQFDGNASCTDDSDDSISDDDQDAHFRLGNVGMRKKKTKWINQVTRNGATTIQVIYEQIRLDQI